MEQKIYFIVYTNIENGTISQELYECKKFLEFYNVRIYNRTNIVCFSEEIKKNKFRDLTFLCQTKKEETILYFDSENDFEKMKKEIDIICKPEIYDHPLYEFDNWNGWEYKSCYDSKTETFGHEENIKNICSDIDMVIKNSDFLKSIGISDSNLNYLLYGNPGTGKTTFIREICMKYKLPIFKVNGSQISSENIKYFLDLKRFSSRFEKPLVLLFEDVDRFFKTETCKEIISSILNYIDGIEGSNDNNTIRFFTCNDESFFYEKENKAFKTRITRKINFKNPSDEMFSKKFERLTQFKSFNENDKTKISQFLSLVKENKTINLREFTKYLVRYILNENFLDLIIENIETIN
jgi:hypothetical protein